MIRRRISTLIPLAAALIAVCGLVALAGAQPESGQADSNKPDQPSQAADGKAADGTADGKAADGKAAGDQAANGKAADGKAADGKAADGKAADGKAADGKATDGKADAGKPKMPHERSLIGDRDCGECHTPDGWSLAADSDGGFDHAQTGFPLTGSHAYVSCIGCHGGERQISRNCAACHTDSHQGRLGAQCDQCHNALAWQDTQAIERHRRTRLPLTGVHALLDCNSCHTRTTERSFSNLPADCFACHEKDYRSDIHPVHQGDFNDPGLAAFPRDCRRCHRPTGWSPAVVNPNNILATASAQQALRDHDRRFPLSYGKHRGAACESCHVSKRSTRVVACTGCHVHSPTTLRQRHGGQLVGLDAAACLRCHPAGVAR